MKAVVVTGADALEIQDVPMPEPDPYDALVRIEACGICNSTDAKIIQRQFVSNIPVPLILGHESVGTIVEVGERVENYAPGQRVLRPGARYDWEKVPIASAWGGLAQYGLVTDVQAWQEDHPGEKANGQWNAQQIVPEAIDPGEATALITLKETLSASRAAGIGPTTRTAIVGTGPVARSFAFWAHWLGAPVLVVYGRREKWCQAFLDLGANNYVAGEVVCLPDESGSTIPGTFDRAIEAVGSTQALGKALSLITPDGWVANYGVRHEDDVETELIRQAREANRIADLPVHEEDVHDEVLQLVSQGQVVLSEWISHRLPLEEIHRGFELLESKDATKVVIEL